MKDYDRRLQGRSLESTLWLKDFAKIHGTTPGRVLVGSDQPKGPDTCDFCNEVTFRRKKIDKNFLARYCMYHWKKHRKGTDDPRIGMSEEMVKYADKTWK